MKAKIKAPLDAAKQLILLTVPLRVLAPGLSPPYQKRRPTRSWLAFLDALSDCVSRKLGDTVQGVFVLR